MAQQSPQLTLRPPLVAADTWCEIAALCESVVAEVHDERTQVVLTTPLPIGRLQSPFSCSPQQLAQAVTRRAQVLGRLRGEGIAAVALVAIEVARRFLHHGAVVQSC